MSDLGNKKVISENIKYYMSLNGKTRNEMCEALGVKYTTFTDWVKAKSYPRIDKIELMANYFGIEKSDLIEIKKEDTEIKQVIEKYNKLTLENRSTIKAMIDVLLSQQIQSEKEMAICG